MTPVEQDEIVARFAVIWEFRGDMDYDEWDDFLAGWEEIYTADAEEVI